MSVYTKKDLVLFLFGYIAQCEKVGRLLRIWLHVQFKFASDNHISKKGKFLVVHKQLCNQKVHFHFHFCCVFYREKTRLQTSISKQCQGVPHEILTINRSQTFIKHLSRQFRFEISTFCTRGGHISTKIYQYLVTLWALWGIKGLTIRD